MKKNINKELNLDFGEKIFHLKYGIKKNLGIIILLLSLFFTFLFIGLIPFWLNIFFNEEIIFSDLLFFTLIFGGVSILILFVFLYTIPSSISYYYDKSLINKYGKNDFALFISKRKEDNSHFEKGGNKNIKVEDYIYFLEYKFTYKNKEYLLEDVIDDKNIYDLLDENVKIPIRFLTINPNFSELRYKKLKLDIKK